MKLIVITTEFTQPMYMLTTLFATSYCRDGGSGYHMAVAHLSLAETDLCYIQRSLKQWSPVNSSNLSIKGTYVTLSIKSINQTLLSPARSSQLMRAYETFYKNTPITITETEQYSKRRLRYIEELQSIWNIYRET